jgi:uncharacterized membrane protein
MEFEMLLPERAGTVKAVTTSTVVNLPVETVYEQWTRFDLFPRFMEGVKDVEQLSTCALHWRAEFGGQEIEWDAVIFKQVPNKEISWTSISGAKREARVSFASVDGKKTQVKLWMEYEIAGAAVELLSSRIKGDLERFKDLIETHQLNTRAGSRRSAA